MNPHRFQYISCYKLNNSQIYIECGIPIKLNEARIYISYFGALLLSIILWRLRWNLRCRINFLNSLTINLEMLSLCWNNESSYTNVSGGSNNLYSALSNWKQLLKLLNLQLLQLIMIIQNWWIHKVLICMECLDHTFWPLFILLKYKNMECTIEQ